jgi:hypothetical protein
VRLCEQSISRALFPTLFLCMFSFLHPPPFAQWPTFPPVENMLLRKSKYLSDNMRAFRMTAIKAQTKKGKVWTVPT